VTGHDDRGSTAAGSRPDRDQSGWLEWDTAGRRGDTDEPGGDHPAGSDERDGSDDDGTWLRHNLSDRRDEDQGSAAAGGAGRAASGADTALPADAPDAEAGADEEPPGPGGLQVLGAAVKEFAIVVGMALVLSFIVKTWLIQAFYIPSGSMENTLQVNDRVIVSKLTPGPVDLKRGDIVVFADPGDWVEAPVVQQRGQLTTFVRETLTFVGLLPDTAENHLIKRVIGLPGDRVVCCDEGGRLTVNGVPVKEPYIHPGDAASERDFDITVPSGRVWVIGDHRSDSSDSRFHDSPDDDGSRGSVDERLIVGRAVALVWPLDHMAWLSNPSETFARVPAPDGADPAQAPTIGPGTSTSPATGDGGGEVPGGDSTATVGLGLPLTYREHGGD
jgi:signal peptidase I